MKKILLLTTAAAVFAATTSLANEGQFYAKGTAGFAKISKMKTKTKAGGVTITSPAKYKAKNAFAFGIGAGYYLTDGVRMEGAFDYTPTVKLSSSYKEGTVSTVDTIKGKTSSIMLNSYIDLYDAGPAKIFAGAGLGFSMFNAKTTKSVDGKNVPTQAFKIKSKASFTYALHLGATTEVAESLHADLTYSWKGVNAKGTIKKTKTKPKYTTSIPMKGHHVTLGLRYDI